MILSKRINFIRKIALSLFFFSLFAIIGSLWLQNSLSSFKYSKNQVNNNKLKIIPGFIFKEKVNCSEYIDDCRENRYLKRIQYVNKLGDCFENEYQISYIILDQVLEDRKLLFIDNDLKNQLKPEYLNKDIELNIKVLESKNNDCIKNFSEYKVYKIFPFFYDFLFNLKNNPKTNLGANVKINPFIYGETSISNIVKRFPINYVFKPLLFISVILMFLYWNNYKHLFNDILDSKKEMFVFFGILSAFFLFFHVLFLGMEIDNKIFKLLRKLIIVFFILFEIFAQSLLSIKLYKNRKKLNEFCNLSIINIKLLFVILIGLISVIVIGLLLFFDLSSKVDYILEWNYFAALLFYYFLSFLMWKKIIN